MGSITKTKNGYRAIVRLGKYRNKPIQKCFNNHQDLLKQNHLYQGTLIKKLVLDRLLLSMEK